MTTTIDPIKTDDFHARVSAVLDALATKFDITKDDVRSEFLGFYSDRIAGQASWKRLRQMDNPTAAELELYANALNVNTTWLITGDVRFVNISLLGDTCLCWDVPADYHFVHYGATEPGSAIEQNPDCPVHTVVRPAHQVEIEV